MKCLVIRPASKEEFAIAVEWATNEGWNPGLADLEAFFAADPQGFLMAWKDGQPVASISVVRYGEDYGFLGFYIVHPKHRGQGFGMAIWNAGMEYLGSRTVGLDGVVDQQGNYKKSGFIWAGKNIRYTGVPNIKPVEHPDILVRDFASSDIDALLNYDRQLFHAERKNFIQSWVAPQSLPDRRTLIATSYNRFAGYGTIRACRSGYKIGPLFADDDEIAFALLEKLCGVLPLGSEVSLDVPEKNSKASSMASNCGLQPVFETARMYRGPCEPLDERRIFGITTFELG